MKSYPRRFGMMVLAAVVLVVLAAQPVEAVRQHLLGGLVNADFFDASTWSGGGIPGGNDVWRTSGSSSSTVFIDFNTTVASNYTGGATSWNVGTAAGATAEGLEYPSVGQAAFISMTITQYNGSMTYFGTAQSSGSAFGLAVNAFDHPNQGPNHGGYALQEGSVTIHTSLKVGVIGNTSSTAEFNQNGGTVTLSATHGAGRGYLLFGHHPLYWHGKARYNLAAGIFQLEEIKPDAAGPLSDNAINFTADSTGVMYVNTSFHAATNIESMVTSGRILVDDAQAGVSDFSIKELSGGPYNGYTEVMLAVGAPGTLIYGK